MTHEGFRDRYLLRFQSGRGDNMHVDQARAGHQAHDPYWSADLIAGLEDRCPGRAFDWAVECMKGLLDGVESPDNDKLERWLGELNEAEAAPDAAHLMARGQEIWHEERDFSHTALAQLYAALSYRALGESGSYRLSLIRALNLMGDHEFYRGTAIAIPLALFEQVVAGGTLRR